MKRARLMMLLRQSGQISVDRTFGDDELDHLLRTPAGAHVASMTTFTGVGTAAEVADYVSEFARSADADEVIVAHASLDDERPPALGRAARRGERAGRGLATARRQGATNSQRNVTATGCSAAPPMSIPRRSQARSLIAGVPSTGLSGMSRRNRLCCGRNTATR